MASPSSNSKTLFESNTLPSEMLVFSSRKRSTRPITTINPPLSSFPHFFFFTNTIPTAASLSVSTDKSFNPLAKPIIINRSTSRYTSNDSKLHPEATTFTKNPFQYNGPKGGFETKGVNEGLCVRVDMPGVEEEDVEIWVQDSSLFFHGRGRNQWEQEPNFPRNYHGCINLSSSDSSEKFVDAENVKAEMKNGVLRIMIPNISTTNSLDSDYHLNGETPLLQQPDENYGGLYPFQVSGPIGPYEALVIDEHRACVRIDMPGVTTKEFTSKITGKSVGFAGDAAKESDHDVSERRRYFGRIDFSCGCCNVTDVKFKMKAGVLRMLISKDKINQ